MLNLRSTVWESHFHYLTRKLTKIKDPWTRTLTPSSSTRSNSMLAACASAVLLNDPSRMSANFVWQDELVASASAITWAAPTDIKLICPRTRLMRRARLKNALRLLFFQNRAHSPDDCLVDFWSWRSSTQSMWRWKRMVNRSNVYWPWISPVEIFSLSRVIIYLRQQIRPIPSIWSPRKSGARLNCTDLSLGYDVCRSASKVSESSFCVYVCALEQPWQFSLIATSDTPVTHVVWHLDGKHLLVCNGKGTCEVYQMNVCCWTDAFLPRSRSLFRTDVSIRCNRSISMKPKTRS